MLKKFSVKNYKNFGESLSIDFSKVRDYQFSTDCLTNGIISKMIIYGRNATGKTNLGMAIGDIKDSQYRGPLFRTARGLDDSAYLNADSEAQVAEFIYVFQFDDIEVTYEYHKFSEYKLRNEELLINGKRSFYYNFETNEYDFDGLNSIEADSIFIDRYLQATHESDDEEKPFTQSFLFWLLNNVAYSSKSVLSKLYDYINRISSMSVNTRIPTNRFYETLKETENLKLFEKFLNLMGIKCKLVLKVLPDSNCELYFDHDRLIPFYENASSGTKTLTQLYRRLAMGKKPSLLFFDEFDAFYHYEMAENIVQFFKATYPDTQIILTTHNTNLMTNHLMRPDCLFILSRSGTLTPLCDATLRELREGHNLEKMYISGEFDKYE